MRYKHETFNKMILKDGFISFIFKFRCRVSLVVCVVALVLCCMWFVCAVCLPVRVSSHHTHNEEEKAIFKINFNYGQLP
jgi:hypothetical protein